MSSQALQEAIVSLDPAVFRAALIQASENTHSISTLHLAYLRICLETGAYEDAVPVLETGFYEFSSDSRATVQDLVHKETGVNLKAPKDSSDQRHGKEKLTVQHVQEFLMLGAIVYITLRKFTEAQLFLEHILTTPSSNAANGLMVEAYRKWVLVSCLLNGSVPKPPRTANSTAMRTVQGASRAYEGLAEVFRSGNKVRFLAEMDVGINIWTSHGNLGLVEELLDQFPLFAIRTLQKIYSALPLDTVATHLSWTVPETRTYLQTLIATGQLNAAVEQRPPPPHHASTSAPPRLLILRFFTDPRSGPLATTEAEQQAVLMAQAGRVTELAQDVRVADQRLATSRDYLVHLRSANLKSQKDQGERAGMMAAVMEEFDQGPVPSEMLAAEDGLDDEDMMGDLP
ncbi:hypothetical protein P152DRAFT_408961 [Eremomyces bilateralis CBS 781.70]|uniref:COP9 signalosome complex subunit 3 N-terminal helical repeats domain-containing protein n=1 Tax=Eremomyces bilateralis CBS 781.70 TaxID=1392243 RepID=A0A6G1GDW5_9PEZI|nr:uncharacterized protein P152DRAFT_408961 [Eremomyces bilateralis CBS 781.70]KAF1816233.1 hypothetical protein P152DRAFT_408961 [Eremomyces bilateralis CBS 781.70]